MGSLGIPDHQKIRKFVLNLETSRLVQVVHMRGIVI